MQLIVEHYDKKKSYIISSETIIVLLYNAIKILLGIDEIPQKTL